MTSLNDAARTSQEQILAAVQQTQRAVADAFTASAKTWGTFSPTSAAAPFAPFANVFRPDAIVDGIFDYAHKMLDAQREIAHGVVASFTPGYPAPPKPASSPFTAWWLPGTAR
jgi:hypothetical protein